MASQDGIDEERLKEACQLIVRSADLGMITMKQVRRAAESKLDLKENILDDSQWKDFVTDIVNETIQQVEENGQNDGETSATSPGYKRGKKILKTSNSSPDEKKVPAKLNTKNSTTQSKGTKGESNEKESKFRLKEETAAEGSEVNDPSKEDSIASSGSTTREASAFAEIFGTMLEKSPSSTKKSSKDSSSNSAKRAKVESEVSRKSNQNQTNRDQPKDVKKEESYSSQKVIAAESGSSLEKSEASDTGDKKTEVDQVGRPRKAHGKNSASSAPSQIHRDGVDSGDDDESNDSQDQMYEPSSAKEKQPLTRRKRSRNVMSNDDASGDSDVHEKRMVHKTDDISVKSDGISSSVAVKKHKSSQEFKRKTFRKRRHDPIRDSDSETEVKGRLNSKRRNVSQHKSIVEDGGSVMALENKVAKESDKVETFAESIKSKGSSIKAGKKNSREVEVVNEKSEGESDSTIQGDHVEIGESEGENLSSKGTKRLAGEDDAEEEEGGEMSDGEVMGTIKRESSSDDLSVLEDDEPPKKKRKAGKAKSVTVDTTEDKDEATIKELKSFIVKCGVRKVWSKELAGCDSTSSQIRRLNQILKDIGMKGRPTLEKCKRICARRELEVEMNAIDVGNIIPDDEKESRKSRASRGIFNPTGRRTTAAARQTSDTEEKEDSPSEKTDSDNDIF